MRTPVHAGIAGRPHPIHGFALFALGFRPFYLLAALTAAISLPVWVAQFFGVLPVAGFVTGITWHTHEMVFGFAVAVITGFLFTAVRSWTGLATPSGGTLAALAGLWLLGRIAMLTGPGWFAAIADVAFLPAIAWYLWQPLQRTRSRNRFLVAIVATLAVINLLFHLAHSGILALYPVTLMQVGLMLVLVLVAIMGGRVIPAFTRNAVRSARVRSVKGLDACALASLIAALLSWLAGLPEWLVAVLALAAAVVNALRLWSWDPWATRAQPILWILHLSYAWIPLGLVVLALAVTGVAGSTALAMHAFGVGAIGGMIIGMMTRTARGHTGRALHVCDIEVVAYGFVHLAALMRVVLPLVWPQAYTAALVGSAAFWSVAFALYCIVYWPVLARPRIDGKPG